MVVSELYAATDGIGYALIGAQQSFDLPAMWAWIVLLGVLGNTGNAILAAATRRVLALHGQPDDSEAKR
jgi:ABC-type nitrate/sulfonate/bicarbonate transport system permease component